MKEIFGMISIIFILVLLCVFAIWFVGQIFLEIDLSVRKVPVLPFNKKRPWKWQKNKNLNIKNEKEWITYLEELRIEKQILKAKKDKEEIKNIKLREKDPSLNTNDWEQHRRRLFKFNESQFKGTYYYVGPQGGVYYISERGRKVYC